MQYGPNLTWAPGAEQIEEERRLCPPVSISARRGGEAAQLATQLPGAVQAVQRTDSVHSPHTPYEFGVSRQAAGFPSTC